MEPLVRALLAQTNPPDEIVITDGGSTDGTWQRLQALARDEPRLQALRTPGGRSAGRNAAILAARHDVIACTDGGCRPEPDWLEHLTAPMEHGADWVAGFYRPAGPTTKATCLGLVIVYVREEIDPASFLPSARSMAFRRSVWQRVGGFPEELDFAEDTLFDQRLVDAGYRPVFAGDAVVQWSPPTTYRQLATTAYRWGHGDGLAGLRGPTYRRLLQLYGATVLAAGAALAIDRKLAPAAFAPLGWVVAARTRHKYRHAEDTSRYLHVPAAHVVANVAAVTGFLQGRRRRRRVTS